MQVIIQQKVRLICGNCKNELHYILGTKEERIIGVNIGKCINSECENKGKVVKIHPQIIEVEPETENVPD